MDATEVSTLSLPGSNPGRGAKYATLAEVVLLRWSEEPDIRVRFLGVAPKCDAVHENNSQKGLTSAV